MSGESVPDGEVSAGRSLVYNLLRSFFVKEPDQRSIDFWRDTFCRLSELQINRAFDKAVQQLRRCLDSANTQPQLEYYHLFVDPYSDQQVHLTASMYIEGRNYSKTLASIRGLLSEAGIQARDDIGVPEDYLPLLMEAMVVLIDEGDGSLMLQKELFDRFLFPSLKGLSAELIETAGGFFRAVGYFIQAFLELEREYFNEITATTI